MTKRSEIKDQFFLWLSEHKEALETESLKPLQDAFPDIIKQTLSAWRKQYTQKGLNGLNQIKQGSIILNDIQSDNDQPNQSTIKEKEQIKTGSKALKQVNPDLKPIQKQSIIFADSQPEEPKEIKENCYYTVDQTADRLQVDSSIIYRLIKNKTLPVLNIGATGARPTFRILGKWILEIKPE